jgi:hypothetical protein
VYERDLVPCSFWPCWLTTKASGRRCPYHLLYCGGGMPRILSTSWTHPPPGGTLRVTFDRSLIGGTKSSTPWTVRYANRRWRVTTVFAAGKVLTASQTSVWSTDPGVQSVRYLPSLYDIRGLQPRRAVWGWSEWPVPWSYS